MDFKKIVIRNSYKRTSAFSNLICPFSFVSRQFSNFKSFHLAPAFGDKSVLKLGILNKAFGFNFLQTQCEPRGASF